VPERDAGATCTTVVERETFTCHVCGTQYACDVVVSANSWMGVPALPALPAPACPNCGAVGRHRVGFLPA